MKQGWTLAQIDEMDIFFYFQLLKHSGREAKQEQDSLLDSMGL